MMALTRFSIRPAHSLFPQSSTVNIPEILVSQPSVGLRAVSVHPRITFCVARRIVSISRSLRCSILRWMTPCLLTDCLCTSTAKLVPLSM